MSQKLVKQLDEVSKEVNQEISRMFRSHIEPKDLYEASSHLIKAGGKRLRPFLVINSCEIVGGRKEDALQVATAVELIHNFSLIHDDIMDKDEKRRGVPTVHVLWGIPIALISGDMLFAKAYETILCSANLHKTPMWRVRRILDVFTKATISLCEGQALDMLFEKRTDVSQKEYLIMIGKKTAALIESAAKSGAYAGGANYTQVEKLGKFGHYAGLSFQIIDDVLGLTADEKVLGKPVGSDLREGKRTMVLIHALSHANERQRRQILSILGNDKATQEEFKAVVDLIQNLGSVEYAVKKANELIEKAKSQLSIFPTSAAKEMALSLCDYIVDRKF